MAHWLRCTFGHASGTQTLKRERIVYRNSLESALYIPLLAHGLVVQGPFQWMTSLPAALITLALLISPAFAAFGIMVSEKSMTVDTGGGLLSTGTPPEVRAFDSGD